MIGSRIVLTALSLLLSSVPAILASPLWVYVGAYGNNINVYAQDARTGELTLTYVVPDSNPSYIALNPAKTFLYSTNENSGEFSAYKIEKNGNLSFINLVSSNGSGPAHLSVHPSGKWLLGSNYNTGNFETYPINADGSIGAQTGSFQDSLPAPGSGANPSRQDGPHAHQIITSPNASIIVGTDLGTDRVYFLDMDLTTGAISPADPPYAQLSSGNGPRHTIFHPTGNYSWTLSELTNSITGWAFDPVRTAFVQNGYYKTYPLSFPNFTHAAEIRLHPNGKVLYASNRGYEAIAAFSIDLATGLLDLIGYFPTNGHEARGFNIDPTGLFAYAGNQNSYDITVYHVRPDGSLSFFSLINTNLTGNVIQPVDIEFGNPIF